MEDFPPDSDVRDRLEHALKGVDRAKDLVNQILAFSRTSKQEHGPVQVNPIIKETLNDR